MVDGADPKDNPMAKFPYRESDTQAIQRGESTANARYEEDLEATARELLDQYLEYEGPDINDMLATAADQAVDNFADAIAILSVSGSVDAVDVIDEPLGREAYPAIMRIAWYAYEKDLRTAVYGHAIERAIDL